VATDYAYDTMDRVTSLVTMKGATTLQNLTYGFDAAGLDVAFISDKRANKLSADGSNTDETQTYTYDPLRRLVGATGVWGSKTYKYGATGNVEVFGGLVARTLNYRNNWPPGQQVLSGTGLSGVMYDTAGNMTHKVLDGVTWDYSWTAENRLASATRNGVTTAQMTYDADGDRVKKVSTVGGTTVNTTYIGKMYEKRVYADGAQRHTINLYANGQLIATYTRTGAITTALAPLPQYRQEALLGSMYSGGSLLGAAQKVFHLAGSMAMHPKALPALFGLFATFLSVVFLASLLRRERKGAAAARGRFALPLRFASLATVLIFSSSACSPDGRPGLGGLGARSDYLIAGDTLSGPAIGTYFYHRNHVNSSSVITDANGNEVTRIVYLPFGEISQPNSSGTDTVTKKFTGQEYDEETGLYYYNARYYDPAIGRFVSADSVVSNLMDSQTFNRYSYANNNPIKYIDPTGHSIFSIIGNAIGSALSAVGSAANAVAGAVASAVSWALGAANHVGHWAVHSAVRSAEWVNNNVFTSSVGSAILAGVIIVATAVANVFAGGALTPILVGEIAGGLGALAGGGNVLFGVAVGGALGGVASLGAGMINPSVGSWVAQIGKNALQGAIYGAAYGGANAYAGGKGGIGNILHGMAVGAVVGAVLGAARPLVFGREITSDSLIQDSLKAGQERLESQGMSIDLSPVKVREGGLWGKLMGDWAGAGTLGNTVNVTPLGMTDLGNTLTHELVHVFQWQSSIGIDFATSYTVQLIMKGYWDVSYEAQARAVTEGTVY
jgi:RHS repeat-associated protein